MTNSANDTYTSPLASRNASPEMLRIWSPRHKFNTWRRIWLAVAEAQHEVTKGWGSQRAPRASEGTAVPPAHDAAIPPARAGGSLGQGPLVTKEQLDELRAVVERGITDEEIARASELERDLRHDVMAHVHCLGEQCPKAKGIIHLGCTSQDVVCNADLLTILESARLTQLKLASVIRSLSEFAHQWRETPTLAFTHYQAAQPTTVGRRAAQWGYELSLCEDRVGDQADPDSLRMLWRGLRGASGTQASFVNLFDGDLDLIDYFEANFIERLCEYNKWVPRHKLTTQTYPRVYDTFVLADLASTASVLHKIATDIRLLSNRKEIDEPFGAKQIGSSAMPYKRNPMKCERICGLTRFVMNLVGNAYDTAATQWLERTLDDSSNRRLSLPEAFLALDGALDLMHQVASGLVVHEAMVRKNLMAELPFLATENIMMEAVKLGGDRQELHEKIRVHAQAAGMKVKQEGQDNDLIERLRADEAFGAVHHLLTEDQLLDPMKYVGRSVEQTERFLKEVVEPLRERYGADLDSLGGSDRGV
ncbi:MAG: adenylosuccinate lyase [Phycisphaera sp.]|nr:MAG: adenylosuccinate lyase [Phycisphaera sp.]